MRATRQYVLHDGERVYFEESPVHHEIPCTHCDKEIPEDRVFWMSGRIGCTGSPPAEIGMGIAGAASFHEGCITGHIARLLAGIPVTAAT